VSIACVAGLAVSWSWERSSRERANRLYRNGDTDAAAALYRARTERAPVDPSLRYNLGTALTDDEPAAAEAELARALPSMDRDVRGRALYNTGYLRLTRALYADVPDSVRLLASAAADANRAVLRLQPDSDDAKWNLAMSLRLLDSIDALERRSGREMAEGAVEADVVTRSVNVPDPAEDEFAEDPPAEGEDETVVDVFDTAPLTDEQAASLLGDSHLDATLILTKLIALESRSRWGRRLVPGARRW
jgi:hypothetical protein